MGDLEVTATALHALTILFNVLSTVYLLVIQGSIEMSVEDNDIILNDEINPLLQSCTMLIQHTITYSTQTMNDGYFPLC